jgi:NAD(P)H-dependent FMN reductase
MKILLMCGSIAKKSHTRAFLRFIEDLLKKEKVETVFWDLQAKPVQIAIPEYHKDPLKNPDTQVREFVQDVMYVDGFVLGSPLYHGSYSGVLKNALDNLYYDAFRNKPVALVSNSSSIRNCAHPCEHLRLVVRALYGYVLQSQIGTTNEDFKDTKGSYILENEEIKERAVRLVEELIQFASLLRNNKINNN